MEIHCKAGFAVRTMALAFTAGAVLGAGVAGYSMDASAGQSAPAAHATSALPDREPFARTNADPHGG
jgi:hypothetical protein